MTTLLIEPPRPRSTLALAVLAAAPTAITSDSPVVFARGDRLSLCQARRCRSMRGLTASRLVRLRQSALKAANALVAESPM
jgi:hypothetical protein